MVKSLIQAWWLVILRGVVAIIFGLALLAAPVKSSVVITALVGLFILLDGVIVSISSLFTIKDNKHWWILLLWGLVGILVGAAIFAYPGITLKVLFFLFALWLLLIGILLLVTAIVVRKESEMEWFLAANGIVALILGVLFLGNPQVSFTIMAVLVGLFALFSGILTTAFGFKLHGLKSRIKKGEVEVIE